MQWGKRKYIQLQNQTKKAKIYIKVEENMRMVSFLLIPFYAFETEAKEKICFFSPLPLISSADPNLHVLAGFPGRARFEARRKRNGRKRKGQ
jgi:hypothetical protein